MFSLPSLRKSSPLIKPVVLANKRSNSVRPVFNQSQDSGASSLSLLKPSSGGSGSGGDNKSRELLRSISSGVLIVGSSLGFCYLSHSRVSLADAPNGATWPTDANAQFEQAIPQKKSKFLFGEAYRRRAFFNYEKRIRMQLLLKRRRPADLMQALVPVFPPSESNRVRVGFLRGERVPGELRCPPPQFFMLFDTNNDDLISFPEEIDKDEFKKVMALMRAQSR